MTIRNLSVAGRSQVGFWKVKLLYWQRFRQLYSYWSWVKYSCSSWTGNEFIIPLLAMVELVHKSITLYVIWGLVFLPKAIDRLNNQKRRNEMSIIVLNTVNQIVIIMPLSRFVRIERGRPQIHHSLSAI